MVPHSTPGNDPAFYQHQNKVFLLPEVKPNQFNLWGLDPQQFIEDLLDTNKDRDKELSASQIVAAAGEFANLRFPGANMGLDEQFVKQVRNETNVSILSPQLTKSSSVPENEAYLMPTSSLSYSPRTDSLALLR